ncbi:efflux RND transporter periplasmic adaptor subunit [Blastopirellula sp. J2-11]|uniref:HlyD family secretion protein n=1 Tax=Blastopirellula sp. J2-11 TaxID=2943192 RepID=UPI0021C92DF7|nr:efflux RND transporter periplasmic adaptor subunit [Blastopirellula sp. J2-11]UUO06172.1 efflux RND transporter periplasmic adaptor subunit [Blastopirellula sp. J2-11]
MIALFVILYVAGIWLFYIKLKVRPNPINLAICSVIGVIAVGTIVICWQFSAPTSSQVVVSRFTIQIIPQVKGPITKITAKPNVPLKKGEDILFEIQKDTYEIAVNQSAAALGYAEKMVQQVQAELKVADASIGEATARMGVAKTDLSKKEDANQRSAGAVSELELAELREKLNAAQAAVDKADAAKEETTFALEGAQQQVELAKANLAKAQFDLKQCTVYAPADGFVTNWQAREGTMAVAYPFAPLGTFIDTSHVDVVGVFSQNVLKNVQPGDKVEIALKNLPGQVVSGAVDSVIHATGDGQFVTSGQLISTGGIGSSGKFAVKFQLDDEKLAESLPMGTAGMATIYTKQGTPFQVISTVTVRIKAWLYYLIPM